MMFLAIVFLIGALATYIIAEKWIDKDTNSSLVTCGFGIVFAVLSIICFMEVLCA
jgi:hypothetical protein